MPRPVTRYLPVLLFGLALALPAHVVHAGAWQTMVKMVTANDMIALRDTVLLATGEAGVVRYVRSADRYETVTRTPGGLASNNISRLALDRSGRLWAGTMGKGVSRLTADGSKWDLLNGFDGLQSDSITVLRADGDTVWIGTTRGLDLWDGNTIAGSVPDAGTDSPFRNNLITGIAVLGDTLFVGTADGLWSARLSRLAQNRPDSTWFETDTGIDTTGIDGVATDGSKVFALAKTNIYVRGASGQWTSTGLSTVDKLRDDFGTVLASSPVGLFRWNGSGWSYIPGSPSSVAGVSPLVISEFSTDPSGNLFDMHRYSGVFALVERVGTTWVPHLPNAPVSNDVNNVMYDGTRLWMATDGGIGSFDGSTWHNYTKAGSAGVDTTFIDPASAMMIQKDNSGHVWFANWSTAIERVDPGTNPIHVDHVFIAPPQPPGGNNEASPSWGWSATVDWMGYVYVGGDTRSRGVLVPNGIAVYDTNAALVATWKANTTGLGSDQVRGLAIDRDSVMWGGFAGGGVGYAYLDSIDANTSASSPGNDHLKLPTFRIVEALRNVDISGVAVRGDSVWVLTTSDLERLRASTKFVSSKYEIPGGPAPRVGVHPLDVSPDGTVWVASVAGVRRYLPGGGSVDYTTANSPLADDEVRSVFAERSSGAVWIATAAGLNRFDPHWTAPAPPAIAMLNLKLWPNPAPLNGLGLSLRLSANATTFRGEVIDLNGRVVRKFGINGSGGVIWDGRDGSGTLVPPGVYFVHAVGGGHEGTARVVVLR